MPTDSIDRILETTFEFMRILRKRMIKRADDVDCANMLQIRVLGMIHEHDGITMKELATFMQVASPSATSFVNRLVSLGWIKRASDPENRKLVRLRLTPKGKGVLQRKMQAHKEMFANMLANIPDADRQELARILERLLDTARKIDTL